jgi:hypothetical protein
MKIVSPPQSNRAGLYHLIEREDGAAEETA